LRVLRSPFGVSRTGGHRIVVGWCFPGNDFDSAGGDARRTRSLRAPRWNRAIRFSARVARCRLRRIPRRCTRRPASSGADFGAW